MRPQRLAAGALAALAGLIAAGPAPAAFQGDPTVEMVEFGGWGRNVKLSNGDAELIVTLEVGPRILSYRLTDGENVFKVYDEQLGGSGESGWQIRGGHRLWASPEDPARTYVPDNGPVQYQELGPGRILVVLPPDPTFHLQKEMEIALGPSGSGVSIVHRIRNSGRQPTELAIWSLSVMKPGGIEVIPLPPKAPHGGSGGEPTAEDFAPQFSLALWPYMDFEDPRWGFGSDAITLRQDPETDRGPTKLGISTPLGVVGYLNGGTLFVKRFPFVPQRPYPDLGVNYETFTNADMIELESLGPLVRLGVGEAVEHLERWELVGGVEAGEGPEGAKQAVLPVLSKD
ncbi:hypothetical protein [Tautonia plasticadhaerens]|uniref:DUF4380 domain-containing protein n=1 Tax=Tautonia plasticadhaerens TaxID=2527974 RepID=A0A518GXM1_9BACT|nr:hypothetical protein [Tautonia plasticadhaerens]QDV33344.1 hypothetical protein ElP_12150 [Tautonia plasticadhaerens]